MKTTQQLKTLQIKAQALFKTLNKEVIVAVKSKQYVKVEPGKAYELSVKEGETLGKDFDLIAKKVGNDLEVLLANDTAVIFDSYFEVCATDLSCIVSLPAEGGVYYVVDGNFVTLADGSQIVHFYGHESALISISSGQSGVFAQGFNEIYFSETFFATAIGGGLAAIGLSGAGAGASAGANTIFGGIVLGPVVTGNGLTVEAFQADGITAIGSSVAVNTDGSFTVNLGSYIGVVILRVVDTNSAADYADEATGTQVDLSAALFAVVDAVGGSITVTITPLTTLAAQQAGVTESGGVLAGTTLDEDTVNQANDGVAKAFGLEDIINTIPRAVINSDGSSSSDSDAYGKVLASLSGVDKSTGGVSETINTLKDALSGTGSDLSLSAAAQQIILDGAQQAELDNDNINSLTTSTAITDITTGQSLTEAIKLGFQDTGRSSIDGIVKAYDLDGEGVGTAKGVKINVSGVTANDWVYSIDGGTTWALGGANTSFDLPENVNAYTRTNIMVRTGTTTTTGTTGSEIILANSDATPSVTTLTVDGTPPVVPTINTSTVSTGFFTVVLESASNVWEYSLDAGETWTIGSGTQVNLDAGKTFAIGDIQVRETDVAGNVSAVASNTSVLSTSAVTLSLASDTGASNTDGKTNDATVNVSVVGSTTWEFSLDGGLTWTNGEGSSFELPSGITAASNIQVKVSGADNNTAVSLDTFVSATNIEVSTTAPVALTVALTSDTGSVNNDFITSNKAVTVGGITNPNTWEYSTDGGANWKTGTATSFDLLDNRSYVANQVQVRQIDVFGNESTFATFKDTDSDAVEVTIDTTAPTISAIAQAVDANGGNTIGETITLTITFDSAVIGTPNSTSGDILGLTGTTGVWSGSGATRTFTYTIVTGDDTRTPTIDNAKLKTALEGNSIEDAAGNAVVGTTSGITATGAFVVIDFTVASSISATGSFTESGANDGSVTGSRTFTLSGDTFAADATLQTAITPTNVPAGLTAVFTRTSATIVTLTFTGKATNHADANDTANIGVAFGDNAFVNESASTVAGSTDTATAIDFTDVTLSSTAPTTELKDGGDAIGDTIALTITFDGNVNGLTTGTDSTVFTIAGSGVSAAWSGTDVLQREY
jgi:hypothetical protein